MIEPRKKEAVISFSNNGYNTQKVEEIRHPKEGHSDPHHANPHLPPSAPPRAAHTLPHDIGFHTALEGEYKCLVLGDCSR